MDDDDIAADNWCVCWISRDATVAVEVCVSKTITPATSILDDATPDPEMADVVGLFGWQSEAAFNATSDGAVTEWPEIEQFYLKRDIIERNEVEIKRRNVLML